MRIGIWFVVSAIVALVGCRDGSQGSAIVATGTIEVTETDIASTIPGRIVELSLEEGAAVAQGQVIARIDDVKLQAQLAQAVAGRDAASALEAQAAAALSVERTRTRETLDQARTAARAAENRVEQARIGGSLTKAQVEEQTRIAEAALAAARVRLYQALAAREFQGRQEVALASQSRATLAAASAQAAKAETGARNQEIDTAIANVEAASARLENARSNRDRSRSLFEQGALSQQAYDAASLAFETARLMHVVAVKQLELARNAVRDEDKDAARAQRDAAAAGVDLADALTIQTRARELDIAAAESGVQQAEANLVLARASDFQNQLRREDIALAESAAQQAHSAVKVAETAPDQVRIRQQSLEAASAQRRAAEEAVRLLEQQVSDAEIRSPVSGRITEKVVEVGEVVSPGSPICVVSDLATATLTIYVSGMDVAHLRLGQSVQVRVDGDDRTFEGSLSYISPKAEFTPRNIQTRSERVKLVYAVKIALPNSEGVFKPGMPADATIDGG